MENYTDSAKPTQDSKLRHPLSFNSSRDIKTKQNAKLNSIGIHMYRISN